MNNNETKQEPAAVQLARIEYAEALRAFGEAFQGFDFHTDLNRLADCRDELRKAQEDKQ